MKVAAAWLATIVAILLIPYETTLAAVPGVSARRAGADGAPAGILPGVVVIKLKRDASGTAALFKGSGVAGRLLRAAGVLSFQPAFRGVPPVPDGEAAEGRVDLSQIYIGRIGPAQNPVEVANALDRSGAFEYVEPKYLCYLRDVPNDSDFVAHQQTYFAQMNALNAWTIAKGDTNVVVADVDGGTAWTHRDLMPNLWINRAEDANHDGKFEHGAPPSGDENGMDNDGNGFVDDVIGWNFADNSNDPVGLSLTPENASHGTATAGQVDAVTNNQLGMAGAAWNCRIMLVNVGSATSDNSIAFGFEGIQYAAANGAKIINCSWGRLGGASKFEQDVIDAATQAGALVVVAAGNDQLNSDLVPEFPANYHNALAVGATHANVDGVASFSNYGVTVPVYAPGVNIWSLVTDGRTGNVGSGTSFATPLVSGLAALLKSAHGTWTPQQIAAQIRSTADSIDGNPLNAGIVGRVGRGRVNFARALQESHAGIEIMRSSLIKRSGDRFFLPGDTMLLNLTVRNVMFIPAAGLTFSTAPSDSVIGILRGTTSPITLAPGDSAPLPPFMFRVGALQSDKDIVIKLSWVSNTNERDAFAFKTRVFATPPLWQPQASPTFLPLQSVTAANRRVAWSAGGFPDGSSPVVIRTADGGTTWKDATGNISGAAFYTLTAVDSNRAWAGTADGRILATTNGGASWAVQTYPGIQSPFIDGIRIFPDLSGFALGDPGPGGKFVILTTANGGASWTHLANEPQGAQNETGWNNNFWWTDKLHGWFGTSNSRVWRTTDGGASWIPSTTPLGNSVGLAFSDNLHGVVGYFEGSMTGSSDAGESWAFIQSPTSQPIISVVAVPATQFFWITDGIKPYFSRDGGGTWIAQAFYPFDGTIAHLALADTGNGWLITGNGEILHYHTDTSTVEPPPPPEIPSSYALLQNYPNPFNPVTQIPFDLPVASRVTIRLYDILGRRVKLIVDANFAAGPHHSDVGFNAAGLASGFYFYRMTAEPLVPGTASSFKAVRKMAVIR